MSNMKIEKLNNELPATVDPDTIYLVKKNERIDCYISDNTGSNSYLLNPDINLPALIRNDVGLNADNIFIHPSETINLQISNFNSFDTYVVSAISGNVVYNNTDSISYTAPSTIQQAGVIINGKQFNLTMIPVTGTYLNDFCSGVNKMSNYADGNGGVIPEVKEINSLDCNFDPNETITGVLVYDTFTNSNNTLIENHTGDIRANWLLAGEKSMNVSNSIGPGSNLKIINNELVLVSDNNKRHSIMCSDISIHDLTNITIEYGVKFDSVTPWSDFHVRTPQHQHYDNNDNSYLFNMYRYNEPGYREFLVFRVKNSSTNYYFDGGNPVLPDVEYNVRVVINTTHISIYCNEQLVTTQPCNVFATPGWINRYLSLDFILDKFSLPVTTLSGNRLTYFRATTTDTIVRQKDKSKVLDKFLGLAGDYLLNHNANSGHSWRIGKGSSGFELTGDGMCRARYPVYNPFSEFNSVFSFQEMSSTDYWVELDLLIGPNVGGAIVSIILKSLGQPDRINGYTGDDFISVDFYPDVQAAGQINSINYNYVWNNKSGNNNLFENQNIDGVRLVAPNGRRGPYIGYHTLRVEIVGTYLGISIDGSQVHIKTLSAAAALRKGWVGFGYYPYNYPGPDNPIIDIREFRAGSMPIY